MEEEKFTGQKKIFHDNGELKAVLSYKDGVLDTTNSSPCSFYDETGALVLEQSYENGLLQGESITYLNNVVYSKTHYEKGKKQGEEKLFYPNGAVMIERIYDNNVLHGYEKRFDEFSNLLHETQYEKGNLQGEFVSYYDTGEVMEKKTYVQNFVEKEALTYHKNGEVSSYGVYEKGTLVEPVVLYTPKGKLINR